MLLDNMKRFIIPIIASVITFSSFAYAAFPPSTTGQGGTGSTTPSGILYGTNSSITPLQSVNIGANLTFSGGTLSATGGSGSAYPFPLAGNATTTLTNFLGGIGATTIQATSTATSTIGNLDGALYADAFSGADLGAQINSAYAALPPTGGTIIIPAAPLYTTATQVNFNTNNKPVSLICAGGSATVIKYTGQATSTIFNTGQGNNYANGMQGCTLEGTSTTDIAVGVEVGGSNGDFGFNMTETNIIDLGDPLVMSNNTWVWQIENDRFQHNNGPIILQGKTNAGERMLFKGNVCANNNNNASATHYCLDIPDDSNGGMELIGNSFDNGPIYIGDAVHIVDLTDNWLENPNYSTSGSYNYITTGTGSGGTQISLVGNEFLNDATTIGNSPNQFILNGERITSSGNNFESANVTIPAAINNYGVFENLDSVGDSNAYAASVSNIATSSVGFLVDDSDQSVLTKWPTVINNTLSTSGNTSLNTTGYPFVSIGTPAAQLYNAQVDTTGEGNYASLGLINNGFNAGTILDTTDTVAGIGDYVTLNNATGYATCLQIEGSSFTCLTDYNTEASLLDTISPAYNAAGTEAGMTTTLQQSAGNDAVDYGLQNYPGTFATGIDAYQNYYSTVYAQPLPEPHFSFWEQANGNTSEASTSWGFLGATTTISGANATTTSVDIGDLGNTTMFRSLLSPSNATFNVISSSSKANAFTVSKNTAGTLSTDFSVNNKGGASSTQLSTSNNTYLSTSGGTTVIGESSNNTGAALEVNGTTKVLNGNLDFYPTGTSGSYFFAQDGGSGKIYTGAYSDIAGGFEPLYEDGAPLDLNSRALNTVNVGAIGTLSNLNVFGTASTSALTISNLTGTQCLQEIAGVVSGTGSACGSGGGGGIIDPFTHTSVWGQTTSATSTLLALTGSPVSLVASSSIQIGTPATVATSTFISDIAVGLNGNTNPAFRVNGNITSAADGVAVTAAAAGSGGFISTISSGTNAPLTINAKGSGVINLGGTSSGNIQVMKNLVVEAAAQVNNSSTNDLAVGPNGTTNPTFNVSNTGTSVTGFQITGNTAGNGVALAVLSSGTNENGKIDGKGSGNLLLQTVATGNVGIGTSSPQSLLSVGGNEVIGAATAGGTGGVLTISALGTPAGTLLAANPSGNIIATSTPSAGTNYWTNSGINTYLNTGTNLGIGTTTPTTALVSVAASTTAGTVQTAYNGVAAIIGGLENAVFKAFLVIDQWGHIIYSGDTPSVSGGTSTMVAKSTDNSGQINAAGTALTSVTLTFARPWPNAPNCSTSDNSLAFQSDPTSISTTQMVISFTAGLTSAQVWYQCSGNQ